MVRPARSPRRLLTAAVSFVAPLTLYALTCCRDIFWLDSTELMLSGRDFLLAHPPGYPLMTLMLRVAARLPVLPLPFRLNVLAAVIAAMVCLVVWAIVELLTRDEIAGLYAALAGALSSELWLQATAIEVYGLNVLLCALALAAALAWQSGSDSRALLAAAFVYGLALAHHTTAVLWTPTLIVLLSARNGLRSPRLGILLLSAIILPVALYGVVPALAQGTGPGGWHGIDSLRDFAAFVGARTYRYRFMAAPAGYIRGQATSLLRAFLNQLLLGWLPAVAGIAVLVRLRRRVLWALIACAVLVTGFALAYNIPDKEGYLLPAYLAAFILAGVGLAGLRQRSLGKAVTAVAFASLVVPLVLFYRTHDRSRLHGLRDYALAVAAELPDTAILFTDDYSLVQGMNWLAGPEWRTRIIVSEHHLAFPWYCRRLASQIPVSARAMRLSDELWQRPASGIAFGEAARAAVAGIKQAIIAALPPERRVFLCPQDFGTWSTDWRGRPLRLIGLCYELRDAPDSLPPLFELHLPPPETYSVDQRLDPATRELCRRFAVTASRHGIVEYAHGQALRALADFDLALRYAPDNTGALENKGLIYLEMNQTDSARRYLEAFLALDTTTAERAKVKRALTQLRTP